jgi:hypothetical protein
MENKQTDTGPPITPGNLRHLGVHRLVTHCLNPACRHEGLIDVSSYTDDVEVPWFAQKVVCAKCGARGRRIDVRPNWVYQGGNASNWKDSGYHGAPEPIAGAGRPVLNWLQCLLAD